MKFRTLSKISLALFCFLQIHSYAQTYIGAGIGTFNIPGASFKFRGFGPTLKIESIADNQRISFYLDASYFNKKQNEGETTFLDNNGNRIATVSQQTKYSYIYFQPGFKALLLGDADEKKVLPYLGGGIAVVLAKSRTSYESTDNTKFDDNIINRTIFGFHLNAGLQYNLHPVILELRGNFDIDIKPLVNYGAGDNSYVLTNLRLAALIPLTK